jgi:gamma-glutamyltranspeptidase/glutathione hydrolase
VILRIVNRLGTSLLTFGAGLVLLGPLATIDARAVVADSKYAVAAENEASTRAGMQILEKGGSAVDAAIAASAMLGVTAPVSSGLGGGGFAVVYDAAEKKTSVLDFRETAPQKYDLTTRRSKAPGAQIGVPGEAAGMVELFKRWGKLSLADDLSPAAQAAQNGFAVSKHLAHALGLHRDLFSNTLYGAIFAPGGTLAQEGQLVTNAALGTTLRRIGVEGARAFYDGPIATEIAEVARAAGSPLTTSDLGTYRAEWREPLRGRWEGYEVVTMPAPSAGGLLLLETLALFSKAELTAMGMGTPNETHMLAEAMRGALADRMRTSGDPAFVADRAAELLAPERMKARRARIASERTHAPPSFELVEQGTSHLVVADARGNVVSLTTTVNDAFGSGVFAPRAGVVLNDQLDDFNLPETIDRFGVSPGPNAPRPGARPVSSMTPTIVFRDGSPALALGGSGGMRIAENVTEMLLCRLAFAKSLERCLSEPRFYAPPHGPTLLYYADQVPPVAAQLDLMDRGEQIKVASGDDTTAVQMIAWERTGSTARMQAAGDPRKGGAGLVR